MIWQRTSSFGIDGSRPNTAPRNRARAESDLEKDGQDHSRFSNDNHDLDYDQPIDEENPSVASSRSRSDMSKPMLTKSPYTNTSNRPSTSHLNRLPRSIMRYLCLGVAASLLIFIFSLERLSHRADKEVKVAIEQEKIKPKPPPWESFPFLEKYYGGVRNLVPTKLNVPEYPRSDDEVPAESFNITEELRDSETAKKSQKRALPDSIVFNPYPNYTTAEYIAKYGDKVDCFLDTAKSISVPPVRYFDGIPQGFPDAVMGSADLLGLRNDICVDRFGRLGPYGLGYSLNRGGSGAQQEGEREGADLVWVETPEVDWRNVKWNEVQNRCLRDNSHRFNELPKPRIDTFRAMQVGSLQRRQDDPESEPLATEKPTSSKSPPKPGSDKLPRTAVLIRTWSDYRYTVEDKIYLRSLISELMLLSGGEYTVHFLIQIKNSDEPIFSDDETYERKLRESLPEEFRGMGTLWNERQMHLMYGGLEETHMRGLPVHGVYRSTFMPVQYFAHQHPEYDYFWNWEMDVRTTHHWYHLFDSVSKWAKAQPRKLLWERNSRFYIPSEHGSWEDFSQMVRIQTEHGTNSVNNLWSPLNREKDPNVPNGMVQQGDRPIWGPERPNDEKEDENAGFDGDPEPPTSFDKDKYTWGVGEDADLITFNPLFDPVGTTWLLTEDTTGYKKEKGGPPRRTAIITASRLSRKLLATMHRETAIRRHSMFSEMWPASAALHHGLKAVYVPHPEYIDRKWPTNYLQSVFNAGRNGATGGARTSVFGDREHNFRGTTWYYNAGFPEVLWHRWLGMKIHNEGGEQAEIAGQGRMCLPGMLLHPIKRVELVQEGRKADQPAG
ncbi:hypothetical protein B0A52_02202 [Exophiala mesophila]|uniref:Uncharacterized protein n=1 Tax=Exophiala mesophila TaxID=212818 RepID=A0A438NBC8_EXOME|nr:hypothetical protein B0A52_02202 [Exophiala mesophila]